MKYKLLLLFITTTLFYFLAIAQTGTGKITGTITDIKGKPIAGATVILTAVNDTAITKTISANDDGKFVFKTLVSGNDTETLFYVDTMYDVWSAYASTHGCFRSGAGLCSRHMDW